MVEDGSEEVCCEIKIGAWCQVEEEACCEEEEEAWCEMVEVRRRESGVEWGRSLV